LSKGGSLIASNALQKIAEKRRKEADKILRKATTALTRAINKQNGNLKQEGIANRAAKRERRQYIQQHQVLRSTIPALMWIPVRDRQKEPTAAKTKDRRIALQSLREAIRKAQRDRDNAYATNPISFAPIPIDLAILQEEHEFRLSQRGGLQLTIPVDNSEDEGGDSAKDSKDKYQRSVAILDSIAENADFVSLK
jgi:hypothetical protein